MSDATSYSEGATVSTLVAPESLALSNPSVTESMRRKPGGSILFISVVFLLVGCFAWRNLSTWPAIINYPDDESYEGVVLATMIHLRQGVPIYAPGATGHFDGATYGPLYYLLGERLVNPQSPSYLPLRLLSAFAILGCAVCCGLLAFWLTGRPLAGWLSWFVFVSYGMVTGHGLLALSDSVALLLAFSGFLVAYRWRNSGAVLFAAPLMVLSFYYKPQYIAGSLAVLLYLALEKRYRQALEFAGLLAFCGLGLFALFQWVVFSGQAFWRHFLLYQSSLLSWHLLGRALFTFALLLLFPLIFAVEYLRRYFNKLLGCYLLLAVLAGLLTYSKKAGGVHYFFESVFLLCVLVPALLANRLARRVYPVELVLVLGLMLIAGQLFEPRPPQSSDIAQHGAMQSFLVRNFPGRARALSHDPGDLLQAGLEAPFSSLYEQELFSRLGIISDAGLVAQIQDHRFAVIVLHFDISQEHDPDWLRAYATPALLGAIKTNYNLDASLTMPAPIRKEPKDRFYIYVPRPPASAPAASGDDGSFPRGGRFPQAASVTSLEGR
jgi:hypothetical protein